MNPASAKTSLNQVPALHKFVATMCFSVFDFGAGKKGKIDEFYRNRPCPHVYVAYDPFNRTQEENVAAWRYLEDHGTDVVTCANVLNVIEDEHLPRVIDSLADATRQTKNGVCFLSVYHKRKFAINRKVGDHFQRNQPLSWYVPHLRSKFWKVERIGNILVCST